MGVVRLDTQSETVIKVTDDEEEPMEVVLKGRFIEAAGIVDGAGRAQDVVVCKGDLDEVSKIGNAVGKGLEAEVFESCRSLVDNLGGEASASDFHGTDSRFANCPLAPTAELALSK